MENRKTNVESKVTTRIPLPLRPLPALPKHLVNNKRTEKMKSVRQPLETISLPPNASTASTSKETRPAQPTSEHKRSLKIDTKHVTVRPNRETLDWEFKIFKDETNSQSNERISQELEVDENKPSGSGPPVTPYAPIENKSIKNIKKSLKRPHSRELLGVSTPKTKQRREQEYFKRQLKFGETLQETLQSPEESKRLYTRCVERDYSNEIFLHLLAVEEKPLAVPKRESITRACVVAWLMKVNGSSGNPAIVQSACWYFDSIIGTQKVSLNKIQLVAVACYWISQKLYGPPAKASRLVRCSNNAFSASQLLYAEKFVVTRLNYPKQPVVPQDFITYLAWWCHQEHPGEIEVAATFLAMSGLMVDRTLCEEVPSVIGAVAVKTAIMLLDIKPTREIEHCSLYKAAEKKTASMILVSYSLRRAVRTVADPKYEYKTPLEHYGLAPYNIAQKIIDAAVKMAVMEPKPARRKDSVSFKL